MVSRKLAHGVRFWFSPVREGARCCPAAAQIQLQEKMQEQLKGSSVVAAAKRVKREQQVLRFINWQASS